MTRRVYKYRLDMSGHRQDIHMPEGCVVLHVGKQEREGIHLWAEVNISRGPQLRTFRIVATGDDIAEDEIWRGTVIDGPFVWHIYETPRA